MSLPPNIHRIFYKNYSFSHDKSVIKWWHQIRLPDGTITPGQDISEERFAHILPFIPDLKGKIVLDVGAWDGFFSFKAEQLGAKRVLATDYFCWSGPGWGNKLGFDYAKRRLRSKVESLEIDVPDISVATVGQFDVVFMFGLLYHLPSILTSFTNIAECATETLIIETLEDRDIAQDIPLLRFYPFNECHNDPTNWFVPNPAAIKAMYKYAGFKKIQESHYWIGTEFPRGIYASSKPKINHL